MPSATNEPSESPRDPLQSIWSGETPDSPESECVQCGRQAVERIEFGSEGAGLSACEDCAPGLTVVLPVMWKGKLGSGVEEPALLMVGQTEDGTAYVLTVDPDDTLLLRIDTLDSYVEVPLVDFVEASLAAVAVELDL